MPASAGEAAIDYEKVLVPVFLRQPLPGAFGSLWTTELWIRNNTAQAVDIQNYDYPCLLPEGCLPMPATPPGIAFRAQIGVPAPGFRGTFLLVERRFASDVEFGLRLQDLSRQNLTRGTEVPVVREGEFRAKKLGLLDVPTGSGFRHVLRIYGLDGTRAAQVTIRVYTINPANTSAFLTQPDPLLGERIANLQSVGPIAPMSPSYIEVPDLNAIAPLTGTERVRVEIEPITPGLQFWAFVLVVNNETQNATVVAPK